MANVLGTLFQNIANAIREKTGDTGTMKPAEFPDKIAALEVSGDTVLENVEITPNFASGNQTATAEDGTVMKSVVILKPSTLLPANIAKGVTIAGVVGSLESSGDSEEILYNTYGFTANGTILTYSKTVTSSYGYGAFGFVGGIAVDWVYLIPDDGYEYTLGCQYSFTRGVWIYDYRIHNGDTLSIPYTGTLVSYTTPDCLKFVSDDGNTLTFDGRVVGNGTLAIETTAGSTSYTIIVG